MKKYMRRILAVLICLALLAAMTAVCFADFGGFAGDGDYGGGGGGGGGGDRSYSGSGGESSGFDFLTTVAMIIVVVIGYLIWSGIKKLYYKITGKQPKPKTRSSGAAGGAAKLPMLAPMVTYRDKDPSFDAEALRQRLSNLYVQFQEAWTAKDISSLRPYLSDAFYAQAERQLEAIASKGRTNYVDRITVLSVTLDGWNCRDGNDHIYATLQTRIVDYTKDDKTGKVVSGSERTEKFMTYRWHLERPVGQTGTAVGGTRSLSCPHCGAPLNINETAKCPYCDSVITVEAHNFVLTEIQGLAQRNG